MSTGPADRETRITTGNSVPQAQHRVLVPQDQPGRYAPPPEHIECSPTQPVRETDQHRASQPVDDGQHNAAVQTGIAYSSGAAYIIRFQSKGKRKDMLSPA